MKNEIDFLLSEIDQLVLDHSFSYDLAQLNSKALLQEITPSLDQRLTFDINQFIKNLTLATFNLQKIAKEVEYKDIIGDIQSIILRFAKAWENLSILRPTIKQSALINSAILYEIAGYQANSIGLMKHIFDRRSHENYDFLSVVINFLLRRYLMTNIQSRQIQSKKVTNVSDLSDALCAKGISMTCNYFLNGNINSLNQGLKLLSKALELNNSTNDVQKSIIVHGIICMLPTMKDRSTWNYFKDKKILKMKKWSKYLKLLARGTGKDMLRSPSVSELWVSQVNALENNLFDESNKIIKLPTGSGKTRIAEMAIIHDLITKGKKCVYIAPYRSLVDELERTFSTVLSELGFRVTTMVEYSYSKDYFQEILADNSDLLILTPEKMDILYRNKPELIENISLVIIDEAHIIEDRQRGFKFELLINRLKKNFPQLTFLFLSAVISDDTIKDFSNWFSIDDNHVVTNSWRPTLQRFSSFKWKRNYGEINYIDDGNVISEYVPKIIEKKKYLLTQDGIEKSYEFPDGNNKSQTASELAWKFSESGSVLIFCSQKNFVKSVGKAMLRRIELAALESDPKLAYFVPSKESLSTLVAKEWLGKDHPIFQLLLKGIGIHHGLLPDMLKRAIEFDFKNRRLRVLISTNTVAQGVNLPIRTVIIHSCWRTQPTPKRIPARDYWNIVGRAGRAGEETQGLAIHIVHKEMDKKDMYHYLLKKTDLEPVQSALFILLKEMIIGNQESYSEFVDYLDPEIITLMAEEKTISGENIWSFFENTLANIQIRENKFSEIYLEKFKQCALEVYSKINRDIDHRYLKAYGRTGLSSESCNLITDYIKNNDVWAQSFLKSDSFGESTKSLIDFVTSLKESNRNEDLPVHYYDLFNHWTKGESIETIISEFENKLKSEELTRFIEDNFSNNLPWILSGFIQILIESYSLDEKKVTNYVKFLPSMIKYGVPSPVASWAITLGIPYREAAINISNRYYQEKDADFNDFLTYLSNLSIEDLHRDFNLRSPLAEEVYTTLLKTTSLEKSKELDFPIETFVVGVKYADVSTAIKVEKEVELNLIREYQNRVDRNAIKVVFEGKQIGYLEKQLVKFLAPEIDSGLELKATVSEIIKNIVPEIKITITKQISHA